MLKLQIDEISLGGCTQHLTIEQSAYEKINCPICSSNKSLLLTQVCGTQSNALESSFCRDCEHWYLSRRPSNEWFLNYYRDDWEKYSAPGLPVKKMLRNLSPLRSLWRQILRIKRGRKNRLGLFHPDIADDGRSIQFFAFMLGLIEQDDNVFGQMDGIKNVLEIGTGDGRMLSIFHDRGFSAVGVEASRNRARRCRDMGLDVLDIAFDDLPTLATKGPFDFIYSSHVLEHVLDPVAHIKQLRTLLRAGGYLYFQVPNFHYDSSLIHRAHSIVHCQGFSPRSLMKLLQDQGFSIVRIMVDGNLHVLARLAEAQDPCPEIPLYSGSGSVEPWRRLFEKTTEDRSMSFHWDHIRLELRKRNGEVSYRRELNLNIHPLKFLHEMKFQACKDGEDLFPIVFQYPESEASFWCKQM